LYEELGAGCVAKLRGMFGFALYDQKQQKVLLARDRLGKKPLHYALRNGELIFGSEIKSLFEAAPELARVNQHAILQYLHFGYIPDPGTAFREIHKLPPGYLLEFENGKITLQQYWDLPVSEEPASRPAQREEEIIGELEGHLRDAVSMRLISDVPLGALLSGGVDSSTIVALMARVSNAPVKTFSIGFSDQDFDESKYARLVAKTFGTEHHELTVKPELSQVLQAISSSLEEPFADPSVVPTYYVSQMAREHVTVALSGDGGDELFAGYDRYPTALQKQWLPAAVGSWFRAHCFHHLPVGMRGRNFLYLMSWRGDARYLDSIAHLPVDRERHLFNDEFLQWAGSQPSALEEFHAHLRMAATKDPLSQLQYLDTKTYLPADVLTKVDRMSMLNSLEIRVPLLDHVVAEYASRLPVRFKLRNGEKKYILRRLAERLGVPREVLNRPKRGFAMPLVHWMRDELKRDLLEILTEPVTLQRGYFKPSAVRGLIREHCDGVRDRSYQLWLLLMFELWHRNFLEGRLRNRPSDFERHGALPMEYATVNDVRSH
jgi:asparagine synthase (glutamine-hydrolysing)